MWNGGGAPYGAGHLKSIHLPNCVTIIGSDAFLGSELKEITFSANVVEIGPRALSCEIINFGGTVQ